MPSHRIWNVVRKSTVEMSCDVEAAPKAVVKWVDTNDHSIAVVLEKINVSLLTLLILTQNLAISSVESDAKVFIIF